MGEKTFKTFIIGLTGTIGSGKSFVAETLRELGAEIIDTDVIAREVVEPGTPGLKAIAARWGDRVLKADGTLDRDAVAGIVFKDESERAWLNGHLHPIIAMETAEQLRRSAKPVTVLVVPLLFESRMDAMADQTWTVIADDETLVERIMKRDSCGRDAALARIRTQMSQDEKAKRSHVVINNCGTMEETKEQTREAYDRIEKS